MLLVFVEDGLSRRVKIVIRQGRCAADSRCDERQRQRAHRFSDSEVEHDLPTSRIADKMSRSIGAERIEHR